MGQRPAVRSRWLLAHRRTLLLGPLLVGCLAIVAAIVWPSGSMVAALVGMVVAAVLGIVFVALWAADYWVSKEQIGSLEVLLLILHAPHMLAVLGISLLCLYAVAFVVMNGLV